MKLAEIGEFGLIERLSRDTIVAPERVVKGIGDDTAVLKWSNRKYLLATCDMMIEGEHFLLGTITPAQLGHKALAINLSDIASMGGVPRHALVSIGLTPELEVEFVEQLYEGMKGLARQFGVNIVGGDTVSSPHDLVIDVMVIGEVEPVNLVLRSGAEPGDLIMVTGRVGASAAGLSLVLGREVEIDCPAYLREKVMSAHFTPIPRIKEARVIVKNGGATAMDDISDGLSSEVIHIARSSGVGALVRAQDIPVAPEAIEVARLVGRDPLEMALHGGEDYELVFTVKPDKASRVREAVQTATGTPVSVIGEITPAEEGIRLIYPDGHQAPLLPGGWDHFRSAG